MHGLAVFRTGFWYMMVHVGLTILVTYVPATGLWFVDVVYGRPVAAGAADARARLDGGR